METPEPPERMVGGRSREHPADRFAPLQHAFDLRAVAREMADVPARDSYCFAPAGSSR